MTAIARALSWSMNPGPETYDAAVKPASADAKAAALVRSAAGFVFIVSGALKLLFENQGVGRFTKLGFPAPLLLATGVALVEIVGGVLLIAGLAARAAALALAMDMVVAIVVTKLPLLWGAGPEPVAAPPKTSVLAFLYQARLDLTMLAITVAVALAGAGALSLDARRKRER